MMTPDEYGDLSSHFGRLAETALDPYARYQLQMLSESYKALARSAEVLNRSVKALDTTARHGKTW